MCCTWGLVGTTNEAALTCGTGKVVIAVAEDRSAAMTAAALQVGLAASSSAAAPAASGAEALVPIA